MREFREAIRVDRIAIRGVRWIAAGKRDVSPEAGAWFAIHDRWSALARQCQRLTNYIWREWVAFHTSAASATQVIAYMEAAREWNRSPTKERGPKPKCAVLALDPRFRATLRAKAQAAFPDLNARPLGLVLQKTEKTIKNGRGVRSAFPRWMQVLADEQVIPGWSHPIPIPLSNTRCRFSLVTIAEAEGESHDEWQAAFRVDRLGGAAAAADSTEDVVVLRTKGRNRKTLEALASGEYARCGASLDYSDRKNEWHLLLGYRMPTKAVDGLAVDRVAVVRAGEQSALVYTAPDGREIPVGGKCEDVAYKRAMLDRCRQSRNANYRWSRGAAKGHGRTRAQTDPHQDFVGQWSRFCLSRNQQMAAWIVKLALEHGCGRIVYSQPTDHDGLLLAAAGKTAETRIASGWPWHRLGQILQQSAMQVGIAVEVVKSQGGDQRDLMGEHRHKTGIGAGFKGGDQRDLMGEHRVRGLQQCPQGWRPA